MANFSLYAEMAPEDVTWWRPSSLW